VVVVVVVVVLLLMFVVDDDDGATYDNRVIYFKHAYQKDKQYLQAHTVHTKQKLSLIPGCMPATPPHRATINVENANLIWLN